jgi:uncharacterized membrane protein
MMTYVTGYVAALLTFFLADMAWLGTMAPRFYRPTLGDIAISGVNLAPAMVFYALYPVGLLIFATRAYPAHVYPYPACLKKFVHS